MEQKNKRKHSEDRTEKNETKIVGIFVVRIERIRKNCNEN